MLGGRRRRMAPSRRKAGGGGEEGEEKMAAFLRDFAREVQMRRERIVAEMEALLKEVDDAYRVELLRLPRALRQMNWRRYYALGGSQKALEEAAKVDLDLAEITKLAAEAVQTPLKSVRKAKKVKRAIETIDEETDPPLPPAGKRSRQDNDASGSPPAGDLDQKGRKAKMSTKKVPAATKKSRPPSARAARLSKRPSRANLCTPVGQTAHTVALGGSTPKFDSSIFKTPGLRAPAAREHVFSVSANGSPLAGGDDIFIAVPIGGGESIHLRASELSRRALLGLNPDTLGSVKKLSAQLANICSSMKGLK